MEVSKIAYFSYQDGKRKTLPLRELSIKGENKGLETIFYMVKDATDIQDLLIRWRETCYDSIEFDSETPYYVQFKVINVHENTNFLKLKKRKPTYTEEEK